MWTRIQKVLLRHELLVITILLCALLRAPSLVEPYWYGDETIYLTLGHAIRYGQTLYTDIFDHKPPLIYFLAAYTGSVFWFRMLLILWNTVSVLIFYKVASVLFETRIKHKQWSIGSFCFPIPNKADVATFLFATLPFFAEGAISNAEIFFVLPVLLGVWYLIRFSSVSTLKTQRITTILAGLSFSVAFLLKIPPLLDAAAVALFFFLLAPLYRLPYLRPVSTQKVKAIVRELKKPFPWIFAVSFITPFLLLFAYYTAKGAMEPFLKSTVGINVGYVSSWSTGSHEGNLLQTGLFGRGVALGLFTLALIASIPLLHPTTLLVVLWFAYALFGALLSERPYPHYLIQIIPAGSLMLVMLSTHLLRLRTLITRRFRWSVALIQTTLSIGAILLVTGAFIASLVSIRFWYYPLFPYYANYLKYITRQISRDQYMAYFGSSLPEQYQIAERIRTTTMRKDRLLVWGDQPSLYALSQRIPPGRFVTSFHIRDFGGYEETYQALEERPPKMIVIDMKAEYPFADLFAIIKADYTPVYQSDQFIVYRRKNGVHR